MILKNYQELEVWKKAMDLVVEIYRLCEQLPKTEMYSLQDQMKRMVGESVKISDRKIR